MKRIVKFAIIGCVLLCAVALGSLFRLTECRRVASPDGRFYAVATCWACRTYVPMMPGEGGDKPGYVTVFTRDGHSCGSAPLPLASMIDETNWGSTQAELRLVAKWNLVSYTVFQ